MNTTRHFYHTSLSSPWKEKCFRQKLQRKSSTVCVQYLFFNRAVYEIMWKNSVQWGSPQMTICPTCIACCITNQTHAQNMQYVLLYHCNNGCRNAPQCYVIHTLPVLFGLARTFKLLQSKHTEISIWHCGQFTSTFYTAAHVSQDDKG